MSYLINLKKKLFINMTVYDNYCNFYGPRMRHVTIRSQLFTNNFLINLLYL